MKKYMKSILAITPILSFCIPYNIVFAANKDTDSQIYQEIGQINMDGLDLSIDGNTSSVIIAC